MQTRAVIFDIDGTLIDSVDAHARAWHEAFTSFGFHVEQRAIRSQIGKGGDQLMPSFLTPAEVSQKGEALETFRSELWKEKYLPRVRPFSHVRALFEALRQRDVMIAVASSSKAPEAKEYLQRCQVDQLVQVKVTGDDVERTKPHPDIVHATLNGLGSFDPSRACLVGDSPFDMQAAAGAGVRPLGVLCGGFPEEDLRAAGASECFNDPQALLENLERWLK